MRLKYKLILIFALLIIASSLPLTLFILNKQESEITDQLARNGEMQSAIIARYALNILLQNGGDLANARVDAREMLKVLRPLEAAGLVYADTVLLSTQERLNGQELARYEGEAGPERSGGRVTRDLLRMLESPGDITGDGESYLQFTGREELPGGAIRCVGRLVFSKAAALEPVRKLRRLVYSAMAAALAAVTLIGLYLGRLVSRPIDELIDGVERLGGGDFGMRVAVRGHDEIARLAVTFNHLAEVIKLEIEALRGANEDLRRLDGIKDEFIATVSHELRTPLYGIIGLADSLIQDPAAVLREETVGVLSLISSSGTRLSHMVNDILDFSRLKHRDINLQISRVDLHAVAAVAISLMQYLIESKSIEVRNEIPPESAFVRGDENRLQQVFLNLLGNAVKFTEAGVISIAVADSPEGPGMVAVSVSDTGIGIPRDRIGRIFESFEQADPSISRRFGGTGLGLAVTKRLVELHGGTIGAESREGEGSVFRFTLPLWAGEAEPGRVERKESRVPPEAPAALLPVRESYRPAEIKPHNGKSPGSVLVIDDEPVNLQVLERQLATQGYRVRTAAHGTGALETLEREGPFDLVLLDVMLPRISGYEVCRSIRARHSAHELPVIMLTARNRPGDIVTGFEAGANDYIAKPVDRAELLARVHGLISLKNAVRSSNELSLLKRDLNIAHEIQHGVLYHELPRVPGASIAVRYRPMKELGGDFYEVRAEGARGIAVLIADVSGHGVAAAFLSAMLKVVYAFSRAHAGSPGDMLGLVNGSMKDYMGRQFITACHAEIDLASMKIRYASAGHWPFVIWRREPDLVVVETVESIPIGWRQEQAYETLEADILPGDRIVFYTDGIIETRAPGPGRPMFGEDRFHEALRASAGMDADGVADFLLARVRAWAATAEEDWMQDDVTLVVIDISGNE
ncbi:MAG: response regulator [Spirochaetes bacterium]|nr:MAG: response regulator [Spirochaetota bacterium]